MRRSVSVLVAVLCVSCVFNVAWADEPVRDHAITVEDYETVATIADCALSPDGRHAVYVDSRWNVEADKRNADLWLVDTAGKNCRRITFDMASDRSPEWGPDSRWIYFLSNRKLGDEDQPPYNGKTQLWRIAIDGVAPVPVTRLEKGVVAYELSHDTGTLYYLVHRDHEDEEWKDLRMEYKDIVNCAHGTRKVSEIWKLDLNTWRGEKVVDEDRYIYDMTVSPDGQKIAMITAADDELITREGWSRVDVYDAATEEVTTLEDKLYRESVSSPHGWLEEIAWSDDSQALAFSVGWDGYPSEVYVSEWIDGEPRVRKAQRPDDDSTVLGSLEWKPNTRDLYYIGEYHARQHVYCIRDLKDGKQGRYAVMTPGDIVVHSFSFAKRSGDPVVVFSSPTHCRDLFVVEGPRQYRRLTDINPQMATWQMPQISVVSWTGANGDPVEGVLELPYDYDPATDGPLPLILELHGGPTAATTLGIRYWCYGRTIMPANGYALLSPNYRGSTGYGDKFMIELIGHENDIEVRDILAGVDVMVERGIADPERLGVMGWSNGGYLTNAVITHTTRFKAASSGAGIADMLIQWGIEDTPGHVINYMQGLPWEQPDAYRKASPIWDFGKVRTPTLIHVGGADARVPVAHSRAIYRALHKYCDVPAMLLVYPDQGHGLGTCKMRKAKMEWDLAWFKRYILGEDEEAEASEEGGEPTKSAVG